MRGSKAAAVSSRPGSNVACTTACVSTYDEETAIEAFVDPTREQLAAFRAIGREGPIQMLNLVRFRERARYPDGREATGAEAYRAYGAAVAGVFAAVGGRQIWIGRFEHTVIGPETERWDAVFIAEYPSADAFVTMLRDPVYREGVKHVKPRSKRRA